MMDLYPGNAQWIGRRAEQQDAFGFAGFTEDRHRGQGGVLVVLADGMGGMEAGGEASRLAVRAMMVAYGHRAPGESIPAALARALAETNEAVYALACRGAGEGNTGTTLVAAAVQEGQFHWIAAGDSRLYLYRAADGSLTQCTQDHNRRAELMREAAQGLLSREQAETDPDGAALTSFVGMAEVPRVDSNLRPLTLADGDRLLLVSDGVHGVLDPTELGAALSREAQAAADALIAAVKAKGLETQDNATVAILECRSGPAVAATPPARVRPAGPRRRWPWVLVGLLAILAVLALGVWIGQELGGWFGAGATRGDQPSAVQPAAAPANPPETPPSTAAPSAPAPTDAPVPPAKDPKDTSKDPRDPKGARDPKDPKGRTHLTHDGDKAQGRDSGPSGTPPIGKGERQGTGPVPPLPPPGTTR